MTQMNRVQGWSGPVPFVCRYLPLLPVIRVLVISAIIVCLVYIGRPFVYVELPKTKSTPTQYKITVWVNDFHISPINDIKDQLSSPSVRFIDKSLSGHCSLTKTCATDLKVINQDNGLGPNLEVQKKFYEAYKDDPEMNQVNMFMCFHPACMCEMFMPFNRTIVVIASTRYELARFGKEDWTKWNANLQKIASDPRNVVAGNNLYDAEYIRYFTGIKAIVLPSLCAYTKVSYNPDYELPFLLTPMNARNFRRKFHSMLSNSLKRLKTTLRLVHLREYYKTNYKYSQIAQHPAIVYVPYQVSVMSLFEQYRMNIPLFFPSLDLLTEWHYRYQVVNERTWDGVGLKRKNSSTIPGALGPCIPDPNNDLDVEAIRYWLKFADFYQWPHITYFNSTDELVIKLKTTNFTHISEQMKIYNADLKVRLAKQWREILSRTAPL